MRLVLLAGPHAGIAAGVRRGRADTTARPFGGLVAGVAPALVIIGDRPAAVEIPPHRRIRVRQCLGANFRDERGAQAGQVSPVSLRPALAAVQVLVTGTGQHRPRWIQRAHESGRFFINVAIDSAWALLPNSPLLVCCPSSRSY